MSDIIVVTINIFGVLVSLFCVMVTLLIYQKYKLNSTIFFIITSVFVLIWNGLHLVLNFVPEDYSEFSHIRIIWLILVYSGITFFYSFVFGYSNLRYENLNWRLILYTGIGTAFIILFATQPDWVTVAYDPIDGWVTRVIYQPFWSLFSISVLILGFVEIIIPLVNTYSRIENDKSIVMTMLISVLLAIFSNAFEPILVTIGLPQAIRFLIADTGFLLFFMVLLQQPFTGLYDTVIIRQAIVANSSGTPLLTLSSSSSKAILTSGAIIGINSILEEITTEDVKLPPSPLGITRKIELGLQQFYTIVKGRYIVVFQFENPSGVCYAKFKSLARIYSDDETLLEKETELFTTRLREYYREFTMRTEENQEMTTYAIN